MDQNIWFKNFKVFIDEATLFDVIPTKSMSLAEQLNAIMRFSIYFTILVLTIKRDVRVIYFLVFVALLTWIIYNRSDQNKNDQRELFEKMNMLKNKKDETCTKPTKNNPFMNVSLLDYADFANRPKACGPDEYKEEIAAEFEKGLHRQENDVFFKTASDRQFFTTASSTIPNDQTKFAEWLFKTGPTFKEAGIIPR
jgi:hypothetical protein